MRVTSLHTYPVKGCHRVDHDGARVLPWGLAGDRRWIVVDADGVGITQRETSALVGLRAEARPGGLVLRAAGRPDLDVPEPVDGPAVGVRVFSSREPEPGRAAGAAADAWLTGLLDRPARLVWQDRPHALPARRAHRADGDTVSFADAYPVLLANAASLDAVNDWLVEAGEEPVPMTRFRPNVVVSGAAAWAEDGWVGRRVSVGGVPFRAAKVADRCVVTTVDQETGAKGRQPLKILGRYRNIDQGLLFGLLLVPDAEGEIHVGDEAALS